MTTDEDIIIESYTGSNNRSLIHRGDHFIVVKENDRLYWYEIVHDENGDIILHMKDNSPAKCLDCEHWFDTKELTENGHCQPCVRL